MGNVRLEAELRQDTVVLLPTHNNGIRGFSHLPELAEEVDANVDDTVLGRRVRAALGHSR
jgi:hypothetical protein